MTEAIKAGSREVIVGGKLFTIKAFNFDQRLKVYEMLAEAASKIADQNMLELAKTKPLDALPVIIRLVGPKLKEIFAMLLGETPEWVSENLDIKGEADLYKAIAEVNDFPLLISQLREVGSQLGTKLKSASGSPPA